MLFQNILSSLRCSKMAMLIRRPYRKIFRKLEDAGITPDHPLWFVRKAKGVIHVGASTGQEAWIYALFGKPVYWFEPIPEVFERLKVNVSNYRSQIAIQALITNADGIEYEFHVSDNDGGSSSIFEMDQHMTLYPGIDYCQTLNLSSVSLDSAIRAHRIPVKFDTLVLDTQGAELLVLKGAIQKLPQVKWIFAECADFSLYKDCCQCSDLSSFLEQYGFRETKRFKKETLEGYGSCYDVLYSRIR
jgi:FkbM family methyltransferase